jgi:hypothetical protein
MIPPLSTDWLEFIESFNANRVEYLIVGAFAVAHHGRPRLTGDLDLWVKPGRENGKRILLALRQFGFGSLNLTELDFAESYQVIQLGFPPLRIDLITSITGVPSFDEAWQERSPGVFGAITASYLGRRHLILNKTSTGRAKDVADAEELSGL